MADDTIGSISVDVVAETDIASASIKALAEQLDALPESKEIKITIPGLDRLARAAAAIERIQSTPVNSGVEAPAEAPRRGRRAGAPVSAATTEGPTGNVNLTANATALRQVVMDAFKEPIPITLEIANLAEIQGQIKGLKVTVTGTAAASTAATTSDAAPNVGARFPEGLAGQVKRIKGKQDQIGPFYTALDMAFRQVGQAGLPSTADRASMIDAIMRRVGPDFIKLRGGDENPADVVGGGIMDLISRASPSLGLALRSTGSIYQSVVGRTDIPGIYRSAAPAPAPTPVVQAAPAPVTQTSQAAPRSDPDSLGRQAARAIIEANKMPAGPEKMAALQRAEKMAIQANIQAMLAETEGGEEDLPNRLARRLTPIARSPGELAQQMLLLASENRRLAGVRRRTAGSVPVYAEESALTSAARRQAETDLAQHERRLARLAEKDQLTLREQAERTRSTKAIEGLRELLGETPEIAGQRRAPRPTVSGPESIRGRRRNRGESPITTSRDVPTITENEAREFVAGRRSYGPLGLTGFAKYMVNNRDATGLLEVAGPGSRAYGERATKYDVGSPGWKLTPEGDMIPAAADDPDMLAPSEAFARLLSPYTGIGIREARERARRIFSFRGPGGARERRGGLGSVSLVPVASGGGHAVQAGARDAQEWMSARRQLEFERHLLSVLETKEDDPPEKKAALKKARNLASRRLNRASRREREARASYQVDEKLLEELGFAVDRRTDEELRGTIEREAIDPASANRTLISERPQLVKIFEEMQRLPAEYEGFMQGVENIREGLIKGLLPVGGEVPQGWQLSAASVPINAMLPLLKEYMTAKGIDTIDVRGNLFKDFNTNLGRLEEVAPVEAAALRAILGERKANAQRGQQAVDRQPRQRGVTEKDIFRPQFKQQSDLDLAEKKIADLDLARSKIENETRNRIAKQMGLVFDRGKLADDINIGRASELTQRVNASMSRQRRVRDIDLQKEILQRGLPIGDFGPVSPGSLEMLQYQRSQFYADPANQPKSRIPAEPLDERARRGRRRREGLTLGNEDRLVFQEASGWGLPGGVTFTAEQKRRASPEERAWMEHVEGVARASLPNVPGGAAPGGPGGGPPVGPTGGEPMSGGVVRVWVQGPHPLPVSLMGSTGGAGMSATGGWSGRAASSYAMSMLGPRSGGNLTPTGSRSIMDIIEQARAQGYNEKETRAFLRSMRYDEGTVEKTLRESFGEEYTGSGGGGGKARRGRGGTGGGDGGDAGQPAGPDEYGFSVDTRVGKKSSSHPGRIWHEATQRWLTPQQIEEAEDRAVGRKARNIGSPGEVLTFQPDTREWLSAQQIAKREATAARGAERSIGGMSAARVREIGRSIGLDMPEPPPVRAGAVYSAAEDPEIATMRASLRRQMGMQGQRAFGPTITSAIMNLQAGLPFFQRPRTVAVPEELHGFFAERDMLDRDPDTEAQLDTLTLPGDPFARMNLAAAAVGEFQQRQRRVKTLRGRLEDFESERAEAGATITALAEAGEDIPDDMLRKFGDLNDEVDTTTNALKKQGASAGVAAEAAGFLTKKATKLGDVFANLAQGFVGGLAAGIIAPLAGKVGSAAISLVSQGIGEYVGRVTETVTGSRVQSEIVLRQLAEATLGERGLVDVAVARQAANVGLSTAVYNLARPELERAAAVEAFNLQYQQQRNLLRTTAQDDRGIFKPTGRFMLGPFETQFDGTPSTFENFMNMFEGSVIGGRTITLGDVGSGPGRLNRDRGYGGLFGYGGDRTTPPPGAEGPVSVREERALAQLAEFWENAGSDFTAATRQWGSDSTAFANAIRSLDVPGLSAGTKGEYAAMVERLGLVVTSNGEVVTSQDELREALEALVQGGVVYNAELEFTAQAKRMIPAQLYQVGAQADLGRQMQRAQFALGRLISPPIGFGEGIPTANMPAAFRQGFGAPDADALGAAAMAMTRHQSGIAAMNELIDSIQNPTHQAAARSLLPQIESLGSSLHDIAVEQREIQLGQAFRGYNQELKVAQRSMGDIVGMASKLGLEVAKNTDIEASRVGLLQGENMVIGRRLQLLGFERAERQLNYRVALAGFMAEGATGEERASRIRIAEKEAEYDRKILTGQREMADNSWEINLEQVGRQYEDVAFHLDNIQKSMRELGRQTALEEKANKQREILAAFTEDFGHYLEEGRSYEEMVIGIETSLMSLGKTVADSQRIAGDIMNEAAANFRNAINTFYGNPAWFGTPGLGEPDYYQRQKSGSNVSVTINNPVVRNDDDIQQIAREVERVLNQKSGLYGVT